jgi:hypothetical protein
VCGGDWSVEPDPSPKFQVHELIEFVAPEILLVFEKLVVAFRHWAFAAKAIWGRGLIAMVFVIWLTQLLFVVALNVTAKVLEALYTWPVLWPVE